MHYGINFVSLQQIKIRNPLNILGMKHDFEKLDFRPYVPSFSALSCGVVDIAMHKGKISLRLNEKQRKMIGKAEAKAILQDYLDFERFSLNAATPILSQEDIWTSELIW